MQPNRKLQRFSISSKDEYIVRAVRLLKSFLFELNAISHRWKALLNDIISSDFVVLFCWFFFCGGGGGREREAVIL